MARRRVRGATKHAVDEAGLLAQAQDGDRAALGTLLERHQGQVFRFGLSMCKDPEDAKDVLQDTLLAAARGIRDFRGASSLSTWLYTIARSHCIKRRRRRKHAPAYAVSLSEDAAHEANALPHPGRDPHEALEGRELEAALEGAIRSLEPKYREVLVLRDVEGLTAPEVSEVLGIGVPAVKTRLHRARKTLRGLLEPALRLPTPTAAPAPAGGCPDVLSLFSRHLEGDIDQASCAKMEAHLAACPSCRRSCDVLKGTLALCKTAGTRAEVPAEVKRSVRLALQSFLQIQR